MKSTYKDTTSGGETGDRLIPSARDYFRVSVLALLLFLLSVYGLLVAAPSLFGISLSAWTYYGLIPVVLVFISAVVVVGWRYNIVVGHITIPSVLFLLMFAYYAFVGTVDYFLQVLNFAVYTYEDSLTAGYYYIGFSLACWVAGYLFGWMVLGAARHPVGSGGKTPVFRIVWDRRRLYWLNLFWGVVGSVAFIVFFAFYVKMIPFLAGISPNASEELRSIVMGSAHNIQVVAFNVMTMALIYSGVYLSLYRRNLLMSLVAVVAVGAFFFWGARVYLILPFLIFFMLMARVSRFSLKKVAMVILVLSFVGYIYGLARNRNFYDIDYSIRTKVEALGDLHIAPEFRDTLGVVAHLDELREEYTVGNYMEGVYLTALPGKIWGLLGFEKAKVFADEGSASAWVIAEITRGSRWTGIRPGIMAQTLITFGAAGVAALFFFYGLLFSHLDRISATEENHSVRLLLAYMLAVLASYSIIIMTEGLFTKFWYFSYGFLLTALIASRRKRKDRSAQHSGLKGF